MGEDEKTLDFLMRGSAMVLLKLEISQVEQIQKAFKYRQIWGGESRVLK